MAAPKLVLFAPAPFGLCSISGPDAERYLHGRVTQDIKKLAAGSAARSLVLTPQGRIQGQFSIYKLSAEKFLAASDPLPDEEAADEFLHALLQFKVADRLEGIRIEGSHSRIFLIGSSAPEFIAAGSEPDRISFRRDFRTIPAFEIVTQNPNVLRAEVAAAGGAEVDHSEFERLTIIAGIPFFRRDITEKTLVPEIDITAMVSFNKGCYAGQEVVEMAAARGRANRKLCWLKSAGDQLVTAGTEICSATEQSKAKPIGAVTSAAFDPETDSTHALGFCKAAEGLEPEYLISGAKFTVLN